MSYEIIDVTEQCDDGRDRERDFDAIKGIAVHRMGVDLKYGNVLGYEPIAIWEAFTGKNPKWAEVAKATGNQNAYTVQLGGDLGPPEYDGKVWQVMPLDEIGAHARRFSKGWIGVGLIADPRKRPVSAKQLTSLVDVLVDLCCGWAFDPLLAIRGHGEIKGSHDGSKAPGKTNWCPGFDMDPVRAEVQALMRDKSRPNLVDLGWRFQD